MKATSTKDRYGRTLDDYSREIIALAPMDALKDLSQIWILTCWCYPKKGGRVVGHYEAFYVWDDPELNEPIPDEAVMVWERDAGETEGDE